MSLDGPRLLALSGSKPNALVILVHGYGSNGDDLISLARMLQPALPHAAFVAPNAPSQIPRMVAAHQWWPIETFSMSERSAGAAAAAPALEAFITRELEEADLSSNRLLLVGFSQGTMMALHVGLRRTEAVAGNPGGRINADLSPDWQCRREMGANATAALYTLARHGAPKSLASN